MRLSTGVTVRISISFDCDSVCVQVDRFHLAQQHLDILLLAQDHSGGQRDFALGQDARRHLVEQRLEQMAGRPRNESDIDIGPLSALAAVRPPKPDPIMTTWWRLAAAEGVLIVLLQTQR